MKIGRCLLDVANDAGSALEECDAVLRQRQLSGRAVQKVRPDASLEFGQSLAAFDACLLLPISPGLGDEHYGQHASLSTLADATVSHGQPQVVTVSPDVKFWSDGANVWPVTQDLRVFLAKLFGDAAELERELRREPAGGDGSRGRPLAHQLVDVAVEIVVERRSAAACECEPDHRQCEHAPSRHPSCTDEDRSTAREQEQ